MLRSLKALERYVVHARDGVAGRVVDFLVDDASWTVRYLVVGQGNHHDARSVLVTPSAFGHPDGSAKTFELRMSIDEIDRAPGIDTDRSVSRQHESESLDPSAPPEYWSLAGIWGTEAYSLSLAALRASGGNAAPLRGPGDAHLRSVRELRGYRAQATDGDLGRIDDFIIDEVTWSVRHLVVDIGRWWLGKRVLVAPHWASRVSWASHTIYVERTLEQVRRTRPWRAQEPVNREYEACFYDFYGRPVARDIPSSKLA